MSKSPLGSTAILAGDHPAPLAESSGATVGLVQNTLAAGFPSPAEDHAVKRIDLNEVLIRHPQATFTMRVRGHSMREAGIDDGDVVLVDRAIKPAHGHIVVAVVDGEFTVKQMWSRGGRFKLKAANPTFPDIVPGDAQTVEIWGVVTWTLKKMVAGSSKD
jgi:DNA polymerase V